MLPKIPKQIGNSMLHKMRVLRQAAINAHNLDSRLHQLSTLIDSENDTIRQNLSELTAQQADLIDSTRRIIAAERIRLFQDLDAAVKYQLCKLEQSLISKQAQQSFLQPLSVSNNKFALLSTKNSDFVIPSEEVGLIAYLRRHGTDFIEPGTRKIIRENLAAGDIAIDIGANFGLHALDMCQAVGSKGKVYAFEPTPCMATALRQTAIISRLRNLHIVEMAVTDRQQATTMYSYGHSPENSLFTYPDLDHDSIHSFEVQTCSLDSFFAPGSRIDLIKIDAEGAEPLIFKGMKRVMAENPQLKIIAELSFSHFDRSGQQFEAFIDQIKSYNFEILAINEDSGVVTSIDAQEMKGKETLNVLLKHSSV